ncbi:transcriptional regulator domain-containing protein [Aminobacter aminovorans]|uniref:transcriptional regulator domain-containing protein n=1 Tax=Aminobacter aminovorans TaxID=83263 RepID=UPI0038D3815D
MSNVTPDALAWEFLRRNPAYQREFADMQQINSTPDAMSPNALRSQWGLRFSSKS